MKKYFLLLALCLGFFNSELRAETNTSSIAFKDPFTMRKSKKVGAGVILGGQAAALGALIELNIENDDGVITGIGSGPGTNTFQLGWKHTFDGQWMNPYTILGYSRWFPGSGSPKSSAILQQVLSEQEFSSGKFGKDFGFGSLGMQYNQLAGDFQGLSFFFQFDLMHSWQNNQILANGSLGSIYYF